MARRNRYDPITFMLGGPMASLQIGWSLWRMAMESQAIIAMRMAGMAGLRPSNPTETTVMVTEKMRAARDSAMAASMAAMAGADAAAITKKALVPYTSRTRKNVRRLVSHPRRKG